MQIFINEWKILNVQQNTVMQMWFQALWEEMKICFGGERDFQHLLNLCRQINALFVLDGESHFGFIMSSLSYSLNGLRR